MLQSICNIFMWGWGWGNPRESLPQNPQLSPNCMKLSEFVDHIYLRLSVIAVLQISLLAYHPHPHLHTQIQINITWSKFKMQLKHEVHYLKEEQSVKKQNLWNKMSLDRNVWDEMIVGQNEKGWNVRERKVMGRNDRAPLTLLQTRGEYNCSLWITYVDLKAAFDVVACNVLWLIQTSFGIPKDIVGLMRELFSHIRLCSSRRSTIRLVWSQEGSSPRMHNCPNLFLAPMDWLLQWTVGRGLLGGTLDNEVFTDLYFADDVALIVENIEALLIVLEVVQKEAAPLDLEISWPMTKIQEMGIAPSNNNVPSIVEQNVEMVDSFVYLDLTIHKTDSCVPEIIRRIAITRNRNKTLDKSLWCSNISL